MSSSPPPRPVHRRSVSSPLYPTRHTQLSQNKKPLMASSSDQQSSQSSSQRPRASRIMDSVKRSLNPSTPKKRQQDYSKFGMQSTIEESNSASPQQFRDLDAASSRPTIEQIAMGLHISRTPHLRPLAVSPYAFSQGNSAPHSTKPYEHHHHRSTPIVLPPPPTRSSMKKPSTTVTSSSSSPALTPAFSSASPSTSTITSLAPSASQNPRSFAGIKFRMSRFLPQNRSASAPTSLASSAVSSPRNSVSEPQPKKAVRFNTEEDRGGD